MQELSPQRHRGKTFHHGHGTHGERQFLFSGSCREGLAKGDPGPQRTANFSSHREPSMYTHNAPRYDRLGRPEMVFSVRPVFSVVKGSSPCLSASVANPLYLLREGAGDGGGAPL